jgi:hypothetical protein
VTWQSSAPSSACFLLRPRKSGDWDRLEGWKEGSFEEEVRLFWQKAVRKAQSSLRKWALSQSAFVERRRSGIRIQPVGFSLEGTDRLSSRPDSDALQKTRAADPGFEVGRWERPCLTRELQSRRKPRKYAIRKKLNGQVGAIYCRT